MNASRTSLALALLLAAGLAQAQSHNAHQDAQPASTPASAPAESNSLDLFALKGHYVAISFLAADSSANAAHISEFATGFSSFAGVVNAIIVPEGTTPAATPSASTIIARDADGSLATQFKITSPASGSSPITVVLVDPAGNEVFRQSGAVSDHPKFAPLAEKIRSLTTDVATRESNLEKGLALQGYDPVSYLDDAKPTPGNVKIQSEYRGVKYRFTSAEHRATFNANPDKYLPAYGGWCATAMADGSKVEIDPKNFKVTGGRVFLFYKGFLGNAINDWNKDEKGLTVKADNKWDTLVKKH
jgi:YHS domain-containing protein